MNKELEKHYIKEGYDLYYVNETRQYQNSVGLRIENEKRKEIREDNLRRLKAEEEWFKDSPHNCK